MLKYSDEEVLNSAKAFKHRTEWATGASRNFYYVAKRRGLFQAACAHMTPKANPYADGYQIYAYEFFDGHAYIGLTCKPNYRHASLRGHASRGPVFDHAKICREFSLKILQSKVPVKDAPEAERQWAESYARNGWTLLNKQTCGAIGRMKSACPTEEEIIARAAQFKFRNDWYLNDLSGYRIAKCSGWFEKATAHMPRNKAYA